MLRLIALCLFALFCYLPVTGQFHASKADSLRQELSDLAMPDSSRAKTFLRLAQMLTMLQPEAGKDTGRLGLKLAQKIGDSILIGNAYQVIGNNYFVQEEWEEGLTVAFEALAIQQALGDSLGTGATYANIGNVYGELRKFESATHYISQSILIFSLLKKERYLADARMSRAIILEQQGEFEEAKVDYQKSLEIYRTHNNAQRESSAYLNMGSLYEKQQDYTEALDAFFRALEIKQRLGEKEGIGIIYVRLAAIFIRTGQFSTAIQWAQKALDIANEMHSRPLKRDAYFHLTDAHEQKGQFKEALGFYNQYVLVKDTLHRFQLKNRVGKIRERYEARVSQQKIEFLKQKEALDQEKIRSKDAIIRNQRFVVLLIGMGLLFALGLSALLYANNQQRLKSHREISDQKFQLERINLAKDKWFSIISHDFRSPLAFLEGALTLINEGTLKKSETEMLTRELESRVQRTSHLLDNLLYWAQNQQNGIEPRPVMTRLRPIVEKIIALYSPQASKKQLHIINAVPPNMMAYVDADMAQLVIRNLISNAIKFSNKDGKIRVVGIWTEALVKLQISDEGIGIAPSDMPRIFDLFDGVVRTGTKNEQGTGLGLALAKDFVEQNAGRLHVTSQINQGTTFTVELPGKQKNAH